MNNKLFMKVTYHDGEVKFSEMSDHMPVAITKSPDYLILNDALIPRSFIKRIEIAREEDLS